MKITCPKCKSIGNIPDHEIHETEGRFIECPNCNHGFDIKRPKNIDNAWLVDLCPACNYSTFGQQRFGVCPKCGITVKVFLDKQWKEKAIDRKQKMMTDRVTCSDGASDVADGDGVTNQLVKKFHPVNFVGWGCMLAAVIIIVMNISGLVKYFTDDFQSTLLDESLSLPTTRLYYYFYGVQPWLEILYGMVLMGVSALFLKHLRVARKILALILWIFIFYFPLSQSVGILSVYFNPLPNSSSKYLLEALYILGTSLICVPIYFLIRFLNDKRITSVVRK